MEIMKQLEKHYNTISLLSSLCLCHLRQYLWDNVGPLGPKWDVVGTFATVWDKFVVCCAALY